MRGCHGAHWFTVYGVVGVRTSYCQRCSAPNPHPLTIDQRREENYWRSQRRVVFPKEVTCVAGEVELVVEGWPVWELLVVGLYVSESDDFEGAVPEDTWVPIGRFWQGVNDMNFGLGDEGPGWISYPLDREVKVRKAES